ncbi:MAG: DUF3100 domain-containing protein [Phascolarctobacterium faecium]
MKNIKVHAIVLALIIIAEMIGNVSFKIGVGTIVLLPMLYALIMGIFMAPKFLKVVNQRICWMQLADRHYTDAADGTLRYFAGADAA